MHDGPWLRSTAESYDRVANRYAEAVAEGPTRQHFESTLVGYFADQVRRADGPVLDVGCGPGVLTRDLASRGLSVLGMDVSTGMLRLSRTSEPSTGVFAASLTGVSLRSGSVAGVFCWYVLHHVPDEAMSQSLDEMARVLKPGGLIMIGGHVGSGSDVKTAGYGGIPMDVWVV